MPASICNRKASSLRASTRRRRRSARKASRTGSLAFWYSPDLTASSMKASCSGVRLMFRVGLTAYWSTQGQAVSYGKACHYRRGTTP
jgi:hypothetical protein